MNTQLIYNYIKQNNFTKTAFAKLCEISLCKLNNVLLNKPKVKATTIVKIAKVMGVRVHTLLGS